MAQCVKVLPTGSSIGVSGRAVFDSSVPIIVPDDSCTSLLSIYTQLEIDALKQTIKVDSSSDPARVQDMTDLFYAFLLVLVVVWGVKQLLNLFTGDTSKD